ncbi:hypothetical protein EDB83DRAFT_2318434 [Lactarius deliciosus]|nr:hypothetical protein EDB83DRAFT_2318434 [Lactarius deliciosus]
MCLPFCSCIVLVPWTSFACVRPSPCTHLFSGAACNPGGLGTRGGGWAEQTDPLASPGVSRRGGGRKRRAGVARAKEDWAVRAIPPLACVGGAGLDAPSVLLRTRAGRGAWGWAGVARAEGWAHRPSSRECGRGAWGWAVRAVPPLACVGGAGMDALSVLLRTRAGRGAWGWAGVARAKGWAHRPSSRVCGQGRAGCWEGRGQGVASLRDCGGPDMGEGPACPLSACEGTAAVNAGDRVGERLKTARDAGRGGVLVLGWRDVMGMGPVLDPVAEASHACHVSYWVHSFPLAHPFADARGQADTPPLPLHRAPPFVRRKRCTMGRAGPSPMSGPPRSRGLATPWPLPSQHLPHSGGKGAHEGTSSRPLPAGARRTACPPQSPSAQATPAQPHAPRPALPAYARGGTVRPPLRAGHTSPTPRAPPCPRTQEDGQCVHPRPAHARKRRDGTHSPAPRAPPAFARGGTPSRVTRRAREEVRARGWPHAREGGPWNEDDATQVRAVSGGVARRVCGQCGAERNPGGGAAHEQKGRHIGAWVRKGESDGEGVVNEAKRSRGEAARANSGTPRQ